MLDKKRNKFGAKKSAPKQPMTLWSSLEMAHQLEISDTPSDLENMKEQFKNFAWDHADAIAGLTKKTQ